MVPKGAQMDSASVAGALREIGGLLIGEKGSRFRAQAYLRAGDVVESVTDIGALAESRQLTSLPSIGSGIASVIEEMCRTGSSRMLEELRTRFPPGTAELSQILSLPRIRVIHENLGVSTLTDLRRACEEGRIRELPGFGAKTEQKLLERIDELTARPKHVILPDALSQARALLDHFAGSSAVEAVEIAGDLRRRAETIDRLDLVIASKQPDDVILRAERLPGVPTIEAADSTEFVVHRPGKLDARVQVVAPADFAIALVRATGTPAHVARLAARARRKQLTLDERALKQKGRKLRIASEDALYDRLGLTPIPAELRDDAGEIEASAAGESFDELVTVDDIRGAVHCHTEYSDGRHTIEEMARAAEAMGLSYLTITDHSRCATYAKGLDVDRLQKQADEIARVQERVKIRLLHGTESDILEDGALDYPDDVLERLDVIVASVHRRHKMDKQAMTKRIVRAMRHPLFKIWGHALGRYVLSRPPFECDMDEVFDAIAESRAAIEVNGDPNRLDLAPPWIREAKKRNLRFVVSTDAHSTGGLHNVRFGVDMARRGWLEKGDVLNTLGAREFVAAVRPAGAPVSTARSDRRPRR
jgi:DNA polymerase (family 10)